MVTEKKENSSRYQSTQIHELLKVIQKTLK